MIRALIVLSMALPLMTFAPAPAAPPVYWMRIAIVQSPQQQACTYATAPAKLRAVIADPLGIPYGEVSAWSCDGDGLAVATELAQRASAMRDQAAAYRAAHPLR